MFLRNRKIKLLRTSPIDNNSTHDNSGPIIESVSEIDKEGDQHLTRALSSVEKESDETGQSSEISREEFCTSIEVSEDKKDKKTGVTFSEAEMSPGLRSELCEIRKFYSDELNYNREGTALRNNTIEKMLERTCGFLWFLKNYKAYRSGLNSLCKPGVGARVCAVHYG